MQKHNSIVLATLLLLVGATLGRFFLPTAQPVIAQPQLGNPIPKDLYSYRDVVKRVIPAVVSIETKVKVKGRNLRAPEAPPITLGSVPLGFGSGFVVDPSGIILTNFHVVDGADTVEVSFPDGNKLISTDIRLDRKSDLALIRVKPDRPLPHLEFANSDSMEVGDRVLAVGAPFGLTSSVTHGIISAKSRSLRLNQYEDFLQTDAAINPGNSGGPLVNLEGKVIGVNSAIKSKSGGFQGVGLAISSNLTRSIMTQLLQNGIVKRGYLGVSIKDVDDEIARRLDVPRTGVLITGVFEDAPAGKAGIREGDILLKIADRDVRDGQELSRIVAGLPLAMATKVTILRAGQPQMLSVTIEEQPEDYGIPTE